MEVSPLSVILHSTHTISHDNGHYEAWSTVIRRRNGQLCLAYSGGRMRHVCPFGQLQLMQSDDEGQSWSWPRVILDTALDDRDGGIVETATGALLISTFSSDAYQRILTMAEQAELEGTLPWPKGDLEKWRQAHARVALSPSSQMGQWVQRSVDGGATWSQPVPSLVNSPHGPISLRSGVLLYPGKELWGGQDRVGISISHDDGQSWQWHSELPVREGDTALEYHELHGVEAANGDIIVQIRNWNKASQGETLQSVSRDGGLSWSTPHSIGVWGLPSHLLLLGDGRLMMTYGYRRPPFGNQARFSADHGASWSEPVTISDDGTCTDLGYPSSVELADGRFLTVWYERKESAKRSVLRQAIWQIQP